MVSTFANSDPFCHKQFINGASCFIPFDKEDFEKRSNELYQKAELKDGYAPFCKHVFIENFTETTQSVVEVTPENEKLLQTAYEARTEKELPVLKRYFPREAVKMEKAKYLDLILYSKEQVLK